MGVEFVEQPSFDMQIVYNEMSYKTPAFFVLFPGVNPNPDVVAVGEKYGKTIEGGTYTNISMGQGQEVHARRLLANGILNGGWVLLQNCHLSAEMCVEIVETLTEAEAIENSFRLWITTEEQPKFPISLLQVS